MFFPCLNDGKSLSYLIPEAITVARQFTNNIEVIVINDGSTDDTKIILEKIKRKHSCVKVIHHKRTLGYGAALIDGFKYSTKEWIFYTDGDGQYDVGDLPKLIEKVNNEVTNVVNGYKINRDDPFFRKMVGDIYNFFLHIVFKIPIDDIDCDFRLIKKSLLDKVDLTIQSGAICLELIIKLQDAGASFAQAGVHHYKRPYGSSQFFNFKNIFETVKDDMKFYLIRSTRMMSKHASGESG